MPLKIYCVYMYIMHTQALSCLEFVNKVSQNLLEIGVHLQSHMKMREV